MTDAENGQAPRVSVIIAHYERLDLLRETLASLAAQTVEDWEALVVDDGSTEAVWRGLRELQGPRVRALRRHAGPKGPNTCRNLGLAHARGQYVVFLDSDDVLAPWCLEQRLSVAADRPGYAFWVFPAILFRNTPGDTDVMWNEFHEGEADADLRRFLRSDPPWCISSPLWKTHALKTIGGFNERVVYGDDADLHTRAILSGLPCSKLLAALPDVFIRRSSARRITSRLDPEVIQWRAVRLAEGSRLLEERRASHELVDQWQGQYLVEAEFLLFKTTDAKPEIRRVLSDWIRHHRPSRLRRWIVQTYLSVALACRKRPYLVLRIARRAAMRLLPEPFFPKGGQFEAVRVGPAVLYDIRKRYAAVTQSQAVNVTADPASVGR
jgi:GT2 family glycosyltransferase